MIPPSPTPHRPTSKGNHDRHPEPEINPPDMTSAVDNAAADDEACATIVVVSESVPTTGDRESMGKSGITASRRSDQRHDKKRMCGIPYAACLIFTIVYSIIRVIAILIQNLYHVPTYLFFTWVFLYPIYFFRPSLFNWIENWLYSVCLYTVGSWSWFANIQVVECGEDLYRIREDPNVGTIHYGSNGNNNRFTNSVNTTQTTTSPDSPVVDVVNQQHNQLNHHNTVNHMMNQMSKDQHLSSMDRISALIEIPSPVVENGNPVDTCNKGKHVLSSHPASLHAGRKLHRPMSIDSVGSDMSSSSRGRILLMANHQSTSDVPLMFQAFVSHAKYVLLWVMDYQFKYTHFGIISGTHGDYFITPKTFVKNELTKHCLSNPDKDLIILFPEGWYLLSLLRD